MIKTIGLLVCSNTFMTVAWYYHLQQKGWPMWKAILISWVIAFIEYCFAVPANRFGYANGLTGYQLKMIQEVVTLIIFCVFATFVMKEPLHLRYLLSFACLVGAVYFMFRK